MAPEIRSHYHKYSMAEELNKYSILDYELVWDKGEDGKVLFTSSYSMFYIISPFPSYFHYVVLDKDFSEINSFPANGLINVPLKNHDTGKDLRALNFVMYDWNHSNYSVSDSNIQTDDEGLLFSSMNYNWEVDNYIKFGGESGEDKSGCIYARKSTKDFQYDPLTRISSFITVFTDGTTYKVYRLADISDSLTTWKELVLPKYYAFWQDSDWYDSADNKKWAPFKDTVTISSADAKTIYDNIADPSTVTETDKLAFTNTTQTNVEWSIYSYDTDSNGKLRNFLLDEYGTNYFRNKYTNNEPINMCIAVPVKDQIEFKEPNSDTFYVSSSKQSYILFDIN